MAEVAKVAELTESYFRHLFHLRLNQSPIQYLIQLRLRHARRLLIEKPSFTIKEAAVKSGFTNSKHFSRLFHRHYKQSPRQFREHLHLHWRNK